MPKPISHRERNERDAAYRSRIWQHRREAAERRKALRGEAAPVVRIDPASYQHVDAASRPCVEGTQDDINQYLANNVAPKEQKRYKRWGDR